MVNEILTAAGVENRKARFPSPPPGPYAVWFDDIATDGADGAPPAIYEHTVTVELYTTTSDDTSAGMVEAGLTSAGYLWTRDDTIWLQAIQRNMTVYSYTITTKNKEA